jgi:glycosyltransferase involved in cell wall biosynthesis
VDSTDVGLISFVIPSYNYGRFVGEAVDSVLLQTYPKVEIIVVDDGSTDDTRERLAPYGDRIRYIYQENKGLPGARNTGIRAASGELVALLDADDLVHRQLLEVLSAALIRDRLDGICPRMVKELADLQRPLPKTPRVINVDVEDLLGSTPLTSSGMLLRKSSALAVGGFDENLRSAEDRDMWLRMAARYRIAVMDCEAFYYRLHPAQMNRKTERMLTAFQRVLDRFFAEHAGYEGLRPVGYAFMHFGATIGFLEEGDRRQALSHLLESLRHLPFAGKDRGPLSSLVRIKLLARLLMGERVFRMLARH